MSLDFNGWLNESEGFSLRMERIYDDLVKNPKNPVDNWNQIKEWLQTAYNEGFDTGYSIGYEDGYEIGIDI
jgi:hypothetical protein